MEDALPVVLCYQCSSTLLAWHELVQCCLHADTALRATLATHELQVPPWDILSVLTSVH